MQENITRNKLKYEELICSNRRTKNSSILRIVKINEKGITLIALMITILFSYDEK